MSLIKPLPETRLTVFTLPTLALLVSLGCQSGGYRAGTLPRELLAKPVPSQRNLQLSSLATSGQNSSRVAPGDLLELHISTGVEEEPPLPKVVRVSEDGALEIPLVGRVRVAGLEPAAASRAIAEAAVQRGIYTHPSVTLTVEEQSSNKVMVLGAVNEPGQYELPKNASDVLRALAAAGGLSEEAGTEIEIMRYGAARLADSDLPAGSDDADPAVQQASYIPGPPLSRTGEPDVQRINLAMAAQRPQTSRPLGDNDVVMVLPKEKRVIHVTGLVNRPDQFELPDDQPIRLLDAVAMAGGRSSQVADKVIVLRQPSAGAQPIAINASLKAAKTDTQENLVLAPGDLVSVESTIATATLGALKDFFRVTMGVSSRLTAF